MLVIHPFNISYDNLAINQDNFTCVLQNVLRRCFLIERFEFGFRVTHVNGRDTRCTLHHGPAQHVESETHPSRENRVTRLFSGSKPNLLVEQERDKPVFDA